MLSGLLSNDWLHEVYQNRSIAVDQHPAREHSCLPHIHPRNWEANFTRCHPRLLRLPLRWLLPMYQRDLPTWPASCRLRHRQ